jgi:hypothetical protein
MLLANLLELRPLRLGEIELTKRKADSARSEPASGAAARATARTLREGDSRRKQPNHRNPCCH